MKRMNLVPNATVLSLLSLTVLYASAAHAIIAPERVTSIPLKSVVNRPMTYTPKFSAFSAAGYEVEKDAVSNAIRLLSGPNLLNVRVTTFDKASFEKAALDAIAANSKVFGVSVNDVRINDTATLAGNEDAAVSLHVFRNGIKIQDAGITFRFKFGQLIQVKTASFNEAVVVAEAGLNTSNIAMSQFNATGFISQGSTYRAKATSSGYSLVKVDEYVVSDSQEAYVVQVDTTNGELFDVRTRNFHLQGRAEASIFPRYFKEVPKQVGLSFIKPVSSVAAADVSGNFSTIDDATAPTLQGLTGQYFKVLDLANASLTQTATLQGNAWQFKFEIPVNTTTAWDNNPMAQSMAYIHLNRIRNIAKDYISPAWFDQTITAKVNNSRHCNAFWDGSTLNFFTAGSSGTMECANTGLISDVMFHEWGHGLDANTGGIEDGGMSEGFGDALAFFMTDDSRIGVDFLPVEQKPVRDVSIKKVYPTDVTGQVHKDGLIIGGTWWDLYTALKAKHGYADGRKIMGKFLFKGVYQASKMTDVYAATVALDDNNADTTDGTPNFCLINKAFSDHGLAKPDASCL